MTRNDTPPRWIPVGGILRDQAALFAEFNAGTRMARAAYHADTHCPDPCGRFKATHLDLCDGCRILRDAANNRAKVARHKEKNQ